MAGLELVGRACCCVYPFMSGCDGICGLHTDVLNRWLDSTCVVNAMVWSGSELSQLAT
jgi:hypothetical protein